MPDDICQLLGARTPQLRVGPRPECLDHAVRLVLLTGLAVWHKATLDDLTHVLQVPLRAGCDTRNNVPRQSHLRGDPPVRVVRVDIGVVLTGSTQQLPQSMLLEQGNARPELLRSGEFLGALVLSSTPGLGLKPCEPVLPFGRHVRQRVLINAAGASSLTAVGRHVFGGEQGSALKAAKLDIAAPSLQELCAAEWHCKEG